MSTLKDLFNNNINESASVSKLLTNSMNKVESLVIEMEKILREDGPLEKALKQSNADMSYLSDMRKALDDMSEAHQDLNMSASKISENSYSSKRYIGESSSTIYNMLSKALADAGKELSDSQGKQSSHSIGGNFNAVVSGDVKIRKNYVDHGYAGSATQWDEILEIGNNLKDKKDALGEARRIFAELIELADEAGAKVNGTTKDMSVGIIMDGEKVLMSCNYARSFCWIGLMKR